MDTQDVARMPVSAYAKTVETGGFPIFARIGAGKPSLLFVGVSFAAERVETRELTDQPFAPGAGISAR